MLSTDLGFMVVTTAHLLLIGSFFGALLCGWWLGQKQNANPEPQLFYLLLIGLIAARIAFVWRYFEQYRDNYWSMLDIRDGGFIVWVGILAVLLLAGWQLLRRADLRKPLSAALVVGFVLWGGGSLAMRLMPVQQLPAIELYTLDGEIVDLAEFQGRPLVINLWASWCPPCRREMPAFSRAQAENPEVTFLFINQGESTEEVERFLRRLSIPDESVLMDDYEEVAYAVGSAMLPTTLFYDASGKLRTSHLGELSGAGLRNGIGLLRFE